MKKNSARILLAGIIISIASGTGMLAYGTVQIKNEQMQQQETLSAAKEALKEINSFSTDENNDKNTEREPKKLSENTNLQHMNNKELIKTIKEGTYGLLEIPALGLEVPVTKGISDNVLNYYVGMYETSDEPGTLNGNTALAGHSIRPGLNYCTCCYFEKIDELSIGDTIKLTWHDGNTYEYEVSNKFLKQDKNSIHAYDKLPNESLITLVTCSDGDDRYRTFIRGKLKKPY